MVNLDNIAEALRSEGFPVKSTDPLTGEVDGAIYLGDRWHVQVGADYFIVMQELEDSFLTRGEASTVPELMQLLRKIKAEIT